MAVEELIMIGIDTSASMVNVDKRRYFQLGCARAYCQAKIKGKDSKTAIGLMTFGTLESLNLLPPTTDLDEVLHHLLSHRALGGATDFKKRLCLTTVYISDDEDNAASKPKKYLLFTGGRVNFNDIEEATMLGSEFKKRSISVDVVNFTVDGWYEESTAALDAFVAANHPDNKESHHIKHFRAEDFDHYSDIMRRAPDIFPPDSLKIAEAYKREEHKRKAALDLSDEDNKKGKTGNV